MDIARSVRQVVAEYLIKMGMPSHDVARSGATLEELGLDSISVVDITLKLEKHCGVAIPDESLPTLVTMDDFIDAVASLIDVKELETDVAPRDVRGTSAVHEATAVAE
jgi:acyl carrier protein